MTDSLAPSALLAVASVGRPHGLSGEVLLHPFDPDGDALASLEPPVDVQLVTRGTAKDVRLASLRPVQKGWLARFEGVDDRDAAAALTNAELHVARVELPPLAPDEFYVEDLVGCTVVDESGNEIGVARGTFWNGAHDVLTIERRDGEELLVPVVPDFIQDVDREARRVTIISAETEEAS